MNAGTRKAAKGTGPPAGYAGIHGGIVELLDAARHAAARSVNALMTASYWEIGHRIVEAEQQGKRRAGYGDQLVARLSADLTARFGRGFSPDNLENMRRFFAAYPRSVISEALSRKSEDGLPAEKSETVSRKFALGELAQVFTLPWSAYVRLLSVKDDHARRFYEAEALRGGWSVRQLDRQIGSQFYERTAFIAEVSVKLRISRDDYVYYPDVMVVCGREKGEERFFTDPKLIVEVLSPSTAGVDRHEKRISYRRIPALEEYLIVAQDVAEVTAFRRGEDWVPQVLESRDSILELRSIGLTLPVAQIYEGEGV